MTAHDDLINNTNRLIDWCTALVLQPPGQQPSEQLPSQWFQRWRSEPHPHWFDIAQHLFRCQEAKVQTVLRHALALYQQNSQIEAGRRNTKPPFFDAQRLTGGHNLRQAHSPEEILLLAAHANGWSNKECTLEPTDLESRLLLHRLQHTPGAQPQGPKVFETLDLTQMLVYRLPHQRSDEGLLLALQLQAVDSAPTDSNHPNAAGQLIRAPGAALLWTDRDLLNGLHLVQDLLNTLLNTLLKPGAPAITWSFASLAEPADRVQSVQVVGGPSATAAFAYGALYLLRDHLDTTQPAIDQLAQLLCSIEDPSAISVTAALLPSLDGKTTWPRLGRVDGVPEKLAALGRTLPQGSPVRFGFVAEEQEPDPRIAHAHRAAQLGQLIEAIERLTCTLSPDARLLHQALQTGATDADIAANPAHQTTMQRLSSSAAPGNGVRAHLLWRYAQLCGGAPSPFGNVAQLGQNFVNLTVEGPRGHSAQDEQDAETHTKVRPSLLCTQLQDIFYPTEADHIERWRAVPAWVILAPPFSGKTTLINHWEMFRIREALRSKASTGQWGEVPVFLPMKNFMRHSGSAKTGVALTAQGLGQALRQYAQEVAPALPWGELLPETPPTPLQISIPRPDGLRVRLCIDALNEYRTGQANESSAITLLCDWLAPRCHPQHGGALLPPVFSVRREEAGNFNLKSHTLPGWQAHHITVQPWRPSQMRAYIVQRQLPAPVQAKLMQALQLPAEADDNPLRAADAQDHPANALASFCQTPGFLSAQCTLLSHWPHLQPSERRAHVMLALAWYCIDTWRQSTACNELEEVARQDPALAALWRWLLPPETLEQLQHMANPTKDLVLEWEPGLAGGLLEGLARVADAMQEPQGGTPEESAPWRSGRSHPGLSHALAAQWPAVFTDQATERWLTQAVASGLVLKTLRQARPNSRAEPWLAFAHQQLQEFFSALGVSPQRLPNLTPPAFEVRTEDLNNHLRQQNSRLKVSRLELPAVTPHTERLRYAADLATPDGAEELIQAVLQQGNLALAAQLAIDQRARLERPADDSGRVVSHGFWFPEKREHCHPLLQHLRARLLLASVDTGAATLPKLHASGLLTGIADTVQTLPEPWQSQWAPLLPALRHPTALPPAHELACGWPAPLTSGVDLRQRLHYGLLLGHLGDNIRFERCFAEVPVEGDSVRTQTHTQIRTGIRLKAAYWALIPASGPGVIHRIGSDRKDQEQDNTPPWTVPPGALQETLFAHSPAVVMQWQAYTDDLLTQANALVAQGKPAPALPKPWFMTEPRFNNPLQPISSLDWLEAQAFTAWSAPLHQALAAGLGADPSGEAPALGLPTEAQHEAAVRFNPAKPQPAQQGWWPHNPGDPTEPGHLPPDLFNHNSTRLRVTSPVGVFSTALTPTGIEAMGNMWTWCSNAYHSDWQGSEEHMGATVRTIHIPLSKDDVARRLDKDLNPRLAVRGGSFYEPADGALAAFRGLQHPRDDNSVGLRWQMSRPIFGP